MNLESTLVTVSVAFGICTLLSIFVVSTIQKQYNAWSATRLVVKKVCDDLGQYDLLTQWDELLLIKRNEYWFNVCASSVVLAIHVICLAEYLARTSMTACGIYVMAIAVFLMLLILMAKNTKDLALATTRMKYAAVYTGVWILYVVHLIWF